jgi:hypothetical protein
MGGQNSSGAASHGRTCIILQEQLLQKLWAARASRAALLYSRTTCYLSRPVFT